MVKSWLNNFRNSRLNNGLSTFLAGIKPPGFQGLSLLYVMTFFWEAIMKGQIMTRSAAISFKLFLAFFPGIIMMLSLIPYIPIDNFQQSLFDSIRGFFPGDTFSLFESTLNDLINIKRNTLLSLGFILVFYYSSNSINAILAGFNSSYHIEERGHPLMIRLASLILIFVLGFIMTVAVALIIFSGSLFEYLHKVHVIGDKGYIPILNTVKWIISVLLVYSMITTLYNVGAGRKRRKWRFLNVGATLATFVFVISSLAFAYFVNNFASYNKLYGSLGSLMVLLIWLNTNCMIVLGGFELNMSISKARRSIPKPKTIIKNTIKE